MGGLGAVKIAVIASKKAYNAMGLEAKCNQLGAHTSDLLENQVLVDFVARGPTGIPTGESQTPMSLKVQGGIPEV